MVRGGGCGARMKSRALHSNSCQATPLALMLALLSVTSFVCAQRTVFDGNPTELKRIWKSIAEEMEKDVQASYELYLISFGKPLEYLENADRLAAFEGSLKEIIEKNSNEKSSYVLGLTFMSDWIDEEYQAILMSDVEIDATRRGLMEFGHPSRRTTSRRRSLLRDPGLKKSTLHLFDRVVNQKNCGSCWAFAATAIMESYYSYYAGTPILFSTAQLVNCVRPQSGNNGCNGGNSAAVLTYMQENSIPIVPEWSYKYNGTRLPTCTNSGGPDPKTDTGVNCPKKGYCNCKEQCPVSISNKQTNGLDVPGLCYVQGDTLEEREAMVMKLIDRDIPVAVFMFADSVFQRSNGGIVDVCNYGGKKQPDANTINHAVVVTGYGTDESSGLNYWLIRNSWGQVSGDNGYYRIAMGQDPNFPRGTVGIGNVMSFPHYIPRYGQKCGDELYSAMANGDVSSVQSGVDSGAGAGVESCEASEYTPVAGDKPLSICERYRITLVQLQDANPDVDFTATLIHKTLVIPCAIEGSILSGDEKPSTDGPCQSYSIASNDTIWSIANKAGTTISNVLLANPNMTVDSFLQPGSTINLPPCYVEENSGSGGCKFQAVHVVKDGETLRDIAAMYDNATIADIASANRLVGLGVFNVGQKLNIPPCTNGVATTVINQCTFNSSMIAMESTTADQAAARLQVDASVVVYFNGEGPYEQGTLLVVPPCIFVPQTVVGDCIYKAQHVVQPGDTPQSIATQFNTTWDSIKDTNSDQLANGLQIGSRLNIPPCQQSSDASIVSDVSEEDMQAIQAVAPKCDWAVLYTVEEDDDLTWEALAAQLQDSGSLSAFPLSADRLSSANPTVESLEAGLVINVPPCILSSAETITSFAWRAQHTVLDGETLQDVARKYRVADQDVLDMNPVLLESGDGTDLTASSVTDIPPGTKLYIPPIENPEGEMDVKTSEWFAKYVVQEGDGLDGIMEYFAGVLQPYGLNFTAIDLYQANPELLSDYFYVGQELLVPPVVAISEYSYSCQAQLHVSKAGQTLQAIADQYKLNAADLYNANTLNYRYDPSASFDTPLPANQVIVVYPCM